MTTTVLLLHAGIADSRMWQPQLEPLEDAGHRVIAPDLRVRGTRAGPRAVLASARLHPVREALLVRARAAVSAHETPVALELPSLALVASAVRPEAATPPR